MSVALDVNFLEVRIAVGSMRFASACHRHCVGSIVNRSSVAGIVGLAKDAPNCASKGSVGL